MECDHFSRCWCHLVLLGRSVSFQRLDNVRQMGSLSLLGRQGRIMGTWHAIVPFCYSLVCHRVLFMVSWEAAHEIWNLYRRSAFARIWNVDFLVLASLLLLPMEFSHSLPSLAWPFGSGDSLAGTACIASPCWAISSRTEKDLRDSSILAGGQSSPKAYHDRVLSGCHLTITTLIIVCALSKHLPWLVQLMFLGLLAICEKQCALEFSVVHT